MTTHNGKPREVAAYDYHDEGGELLFQSVRFEPGDDGARKKFRQRQPDGRGGWEWNLKGVRLVPYRLPDLYAASVDRPVYVVEGEKDVESLHAIGMLATTNPMGAGKWKSEYNDYFAGRHIIVFPDNDDPGRKHAQAIARSLAGVAASVKVVELPGLSLKQDITDWLQAGGTKEALLKLVLAAAAWTGDGSDARPPAGSAGKRGAKKGPTQAEQLLALARGPDYFHTADGRGYAVLQVEEQHQQAHQETHPIRSSQFRNWLARRLYLKTGKAASAGVLQDVLGVLEAQARFEGGEREVFCRVGQVGKRVYIDLGDPNWRVAEVDAAGWRVLPISPVRFRRPRGQLALPMPQPGGTLDELRPFVNHNRDKEDWKLVVAWLVQALCPFGPYPVLCLHGEQGSAKSTASKILRSVTDPSVAPLRTAPRDERDLIITASNSWLVTLDNLSSLDGWLSDALCRLATGGGFSTRQLFSDDEEMIFNAQRPCLLNGIEELSSRPDLLDRAIVLNLPSLDERERKVERELWEQFEAIRPRGFGALLSALSGALRHRGGVNLKELPRMADFAVLATAAGRGLRWEDDAFMAAVRRRRARPGRGHDGPLQSPVLAHAAVAVRPAPPRRTRHRPARGTVERGAAAGEFERSAGERYTPFQRTLIPAGMPHHRLFLRAAEPGGLERGNNLIPVGGVQLEEWPVVYRGFDGGVRDGLRHPPRHVPGRPGGPEPVAVAAKLAGVEGGVLAGRPVHHVQHLFPGVPRQCLVQFAPGFCRRQGFVDREQFRGLLARQEHQRIVHHPEH